jgi:nitroreductase
MEKLAPTQYPIHELLAKRWSPRAFADRPVPDEDLRSLLEAARWAPSCFNDQPWNFLVAMRENPEEFKKMLGCLVEGNVVWAKNAPVLMLTAARTNFAASGKPNRHAFHDVGMALAMMAVEAASRGLAMHMMGGILPDKAREIYAVPEEFEVITGTAIGYPGQPDSLPERLRERDKAPRVRKPLASFVFSGKWGETSPLVEG